MNRYRYLIKNIGLLTLSSFATKLLSFFLVPLYTNILSTTEYGTYDLFNTTIGFLIPILTLNIQESVLRFALDNDSDDKAVMSIGLKYFFISNLFVGFGLFVTHLLGISGVINEYALFFYLMFLAQSLSGIVMAYARGIDKIKELSVSSAIASAVTIILNVAFLAWFRWGLVGYFFANIIGPLVQDLYLIVRIRILHGIHLHRAYEVENKMIDYSRPMIANSVAWWVNNASDRYIVILFCGLAENGIYSVASKIPSILNVFQSIFNQAWTLSAVKDYDPDDSNGFFSNTYCAYNCMLVVLCSVINLADKLLAKCLYAKDFYNAWKYVPWLTIAIIFGALSGYIGGFFSAVKNSKIYAQSTIVGAGVNLILNLILTPLLGALGAAIATAISYFVVWVIRYISSKKYIRLNINLKRDSLSYFLLLIQACVIVLVGNRFYLYIVEGGVFVIIVFLYFNEISMISKRILQRVLK